MGWKINRKEWRSLSLFVIVLATVVTVLAFFSPKRSNHAAEVASFALGSSDDTISSDSVPVSVDAEVSASAESCDAIDNAPSKRGREKKTRQKSAASSPKPKDSPLDHPVERLNDTD